MHIYYIGKRVQSTNFGSVSEYLQFVYFFVHKCPVEGFRNFVLVFFIFCFAVRYSFVCKLDNPSFPSVQHQKTFDFRRKYLEHTIMLHQNYMQKMS